MLLGLVGSTWGHISAKDLAALFGTLHVSHLQRHGGVVTLVSPQLGFIDVLLGPGRCHAHLAGTLVGAHLQADGRVVYGWWDMVLGVIQMPTLAMCHHTRLAGTLMGAHLEPDDILARLHCGIIEVPLSPL